MEYFVSILSIVISSLTTIIVAVIGVNQNKRAKESEEFRNLTLENERIRKEREKEIKEEEELRLKGIENMIGNLRQDIKDIRKGLNIDELNTQLDHLHTLNTINFEYIQSLSNVVVTVGECISSSEALNETGTAKMESEIDKHKKKEDDINKQLLQLIM